MHVSVNEARNNNNCFEACGFLALYSVQKLNISHTRANWQAESSTSYELFWFSVNRQRFPVHSWQVTKSSVSSASLASANDNEEHFLAGYLNCSCLQNKRVLLDTFIVHLSRELTLVSQGALVWHHELACRKSWRCVRLDYRSRVADALRRLIHFFVWRLNDLDIILITTWWKSNIHYLLSYFIT